MYLWLNLAVFGYKITELEEKICATNFTNVIHRLFYYVTDSIFWLAETNKLIGQRIVKLLKAIRD